MTAAPVHKHYRTKWKVQPKIHDGVTRWCDHCHSRWAAMVIEDGGEQPFIQQKNYPDLHGTGMVKLFCFRCHRKMGEEFCLMRERIDNAT